MDPLEFKIARIRLRLTQYQLGLLLHVPSYLVSQWETGAAKPPEPILASFQKIIRENGKPTGGEGA